MVSPDSYVPLTKPCNIPACIRLVYYCENRRSVRHRSTIYNQVDSVTKAMYCNAKNVNNLKPNPMRPHSAIKPPKTVNPALCIRKQIISVRILDK